MIAMAKGLQKRVVAEGVETEAQVNFLKAQNCDEAQGYYFGKPTVAAQFARLLGADVASSPQHAYRRELEWNQQGLILVK